MSFPPVSPMTRTTRVCQNKVRMLEARRKAEMERMREKERKALADDMAERRKKQHHRHSHHKQRKSSFGAAQVDSTARNSPSAKSGHVPQGDGSKDGEKTQEVARMREGERNSLEVDMEERKQEYRSPRHRRSRRHKKATFGATQINKPPSSAPKKDDKGSMVFAVL